LVLEKIVSETLPVSDQIILTSILKLLYVRDE